MATKVQSKNYLPGYYSIQDIKEDATSGWSSYCQEKKSSEHLCNSYAPRLVNGYSEHDKEMLKQTMLEHDAIFRKQVYELHRLYRIQKDLMNEFQSRGFYGSSVLAEASQSNSFSSQMRSECTEKISQMSYLPIGNTNIGKTTCAGTEKLHFNFTREVGIQSDQIPLLNGTSLKISGAPNYKSQKRTFDLQLPADVYIDTEDTDRDEQMIIAEPSSSASIPKNETCSVYSDNDVKLTLGSSQREDRRISNSPTQISMSACTTVDLNKPTAEICFERPANSASVQLLGLKLKTHNDWNQELQSSTRTSTSFVDKHDDQQTTSGFLNAGVHIKREWPFFNHESGKNRSTADFFAQTSYNDNVPTSSEILQLNTRKCREFFAFDHNNPETWSRHEPTSNIQTSARVPYFTCSDSAIMSPSVPSSITTPHTDLTSCASSFVSSWRKPTTSISNKPIVVQTHPCFSGSSNLSNESLTSKIDAQIPIACEEWKSSWNLTTNIGSGFGVSYTNGFHHGLHLDINSAPHPKVMSGKPEQTHDRNGNLHVHLPGNSVKGLPNRELKTPINVNLNQACSSGTEDGLTVRHDAVIYDAESKYDNFSGVPSWLRKKASSDESVGLKKHPQLSSSTNVVAPEIEKKEERELYFSLRNLQEVTSTFQFKDHKVQKKEVSDKNGKKLLGYLIPDTVEQNSVSVYGRHMEKHLTDNLKFMKNDNMIFTDLSCDTQVLNSQKKLNTGGSITEIEICGRKSSASSRNHINLNAEFACTDDPISSEILPQGVVVVQSSQSMPSLSAKIASDIDLEAPISQAELGILNQHKYIPSNKKDGSEEKDYSMDTLARLAAENLVAISTYRNDCSDEINSLMLSLPGFDSLSWFADVVSCSAGNPKLLDNGGAGATQSPDDDGLDLFEAMTLNLEEIKVENYWSRPKELENKDEKEDREDTGVASLLFTKPRRGQARKRRQRRDFQKDILPGLASLSRHEVTEDLRIIGGMMKASGRPWQTGSTRRNAGRNGMNSRARGRRQLRSSAIDAEEVQVNPPPHSQPSNSEIGISGRSMIGWGRTTRRCRRQRCHPSSLPAPLT